MTRNIGQAALAIPHEGGCPVRRARAHKRASWALKQSPARAIAAVLRVDESRVRHHRTDDPDNPVTTFYALVADPSVDGEALMEGGEESLEDRYTEASEAVLRERLEHLVKEAEHLAQAEQDRALMNGGPGTNDAVRKHIRRLREIVAIRSRLGLED